ncbi:MBL fold metallo-hydrolase [Rhizobium laguerreae]|nr:MBL fold metallo-hydrolase [Rhizobium laguerreae]MBY3232507.1 MBL fold metallo-hydrolase [Rhizobium laguerreae]MBY3349051.1 MBL fold metallo-hydrolase [Rhizobium laguerreae]MBY3356083.1 MBL fold metallo-hydrolase [Rhizobium laguerreae]MBY3377200.1 MBL fold metallo-hydrolase [Rhizobium laguerreae]
MRRFDRRRSVRRPDVAAFFDPRTFSIQYVVSDPRTKACAIIDPVLDFDEKSGSTTTHNAEMLLDHIQGQDLRLHWILDTHPHADHLSAAAYLRERTGAPTAIGSRVTDVQRIWSKIYNWPDLPVDGKQWDRLFFDGDTFSIGSIEVGVMYSPGHTLASITYTAGDAVFVHDTVFMPDSGTARADFPGGSARSLWSSIQNILTLPSNTRVFVGHDYQPGGRRPLWESTVERQRAENIHVTSCACADEFVALREARDRTLPMPKLILHALQVNINGGRLPEPEGNGLRYLKVPMGAFQGSVWS